MPERLTLSEFIKRARKVHGQKYDYSQGEYINNHTKIKIICPEHGEFWQKPNGHLNGKGCSKCAKTGVRLTTEEFIKRAKKIHGDKYDYSNVNYINANTKVEIICPKHGVFWQIPSSHIGPYECGCFKCATENRFSNTNDFINKARIVHGNKYNYDEVNYINTRKKVKIICPKHGVFWQRPSGHLTGYGCPLCSDSWLEKEIKNMLINENILFESEKTFSWLKNISTDKHLMLDIFIKNINLAIECHGEQHFKPIKHFGGERRFEAQCKIDLIKYNLCQEHGITILYFAKNNHPDYFSTIYTNKNIILKLIKEKIMENNKKII